MHAWVVLVVVALIMLAVMYSNTAKILVKSSVDGMYYSVLVRKDNERVADALAEINKRVNVLADAIKDPLIKATLKSKYSYKVISEAVEAKGMTSFTVNKMDIHVCIRSRPEGIVYDINTLMYVVVHELAHLVSVGIGHEEEFEMLFKVLLTQAVESGVYVIEDYSKRPVNYCGLVLNSNILA